MPIYEYECGRCGVFEISQRITEDALTKCPTCKRKVRRLISNTSFQLKGSGWYVTDYARANGKKSEGSESKGEAKSESKSETTSESKKAEAKSDSGSAAKSDTKAATKTSSTAAA